MNTEEGFVLRLSPKGQEYPVTELGLWVYDQASEVARQEGIAHREAFSRIVTILELTAKREKLEREIEAAEARMEELRRERVVWEAIRGGIAGQG